METKDTLLAEKSLVESYFHEGAICISETKYSDGSLKCWKNEKSLPTRKACSFVNVEGKVFVPNFDEDSFSSIFLKIRPDISDVENICTLIEMTSPGLRKPISRLLPYMRDIANFWHIPRYDGGNFEAFVDNSTSGIIEKVTITEQFELSIEIIGAGMRFYLR